MIQHSEIKSNSLVLFCSLTAFSHAVLQELLNLGVEVTVVVVTGAEPGKAVFDDVSLPIVATPGHATVENLAIEHGIPMLYINAMHDEAVKSSLLKLDAEYFLVACFPFKLPADIYQRPSIACLNIHPSLLPTYRGPHPVFWQLKRGEQKMGVSLHRVNAEFDAGDIILQREIVFADGLRGRAIDALIGTQGARLCVEAIKLYRVKKVNARSQRGVDYSYYPAPVYHDFELLLDWPALQAFNFMRGTDQWGHTYHVKIGDNNIVLKSAIAYSPVGTLQEAYRIEDNFIRIRFSPGVLLAYTTIPEF